MNYLLKFFKIGSSGKTKSDEVWMFNAQNNKINTLNKVCFIFVSFYVHDWQ